MKRFTETRKWDDPWFRKLKPEMKLLWQWLLDGCDNAGVIDPDMDLASFQIGFEYPLDTLSIFGERLFELPCGKTFIPKFIPFQYGKLSDDCRAHGPVFASLEKHGIDRVSIGYQYPLSIRQGKGQGKEQEGTTPKAKGTIEEFREYASSIGIPDSDAEHLHHHLSESGWKRGKEPIKDWKATMRKWKSGGWLPSAKAIPQSRKTTSATDYGI